MILIKDVPDRHQFRKLKNLFYQILIAQISLMIDKLAIQKLQLSSRPHRVSRQGKSPLGYHSRTKVAHQQKLEALVVYFVITQKKELFRWCSEIN